MIGGIDTFMVSFKNKTKQKTNKKQTKNLAGCGCGQPGLAVGDHGRGVESR